MVDVYGLRFGERESIMATAYSPAQVDDLLEEFATYGYQTWTETV